MAQDYFIVTPLTQTEHAGYDTKACAFFGSFIRGMQNADPRIQLELIQKGITKAVQALALMDPYEFMYFPLVSLGNILRDLVINETRVTVGFTSERPAENVHATYTIECEEAGRGLRITTVILPDRHSFKIELYVEELEKLI